MAPTTKITSMHKPTSGRTLPFSSRTNAGARCGRSAMPIRITPSPCEPRRSFRRPCRNSRIYDRGVLHGDLNHDRDVPFGELGQRHLRPEFGVPNPRAAPTRSSPSVSDSESRRPAGGGIRAVSFIGICTMASGANRSSRPGAGRSAAADQGEFHGAGAAVVAPRSARRAERAVGRQPPALPCAFAPPFHRGPGSGCGWVFRELKARQP